MENRGIPTKDLPSTDVLSDAIQNARRQICHEETLRKSNCIDDDSEIISVHVGKERARKDKSLIAIDHRIEDIRVAIANYRPPDE